MHYFLVIHITSSVCTIALIKHETVCSQTSVDKYTASKNLIPMIHNLLTSSSIMLSDVSCIIVNQGPAPFSTLRSVLATVNGLHLATAIPLVGIDTLKAMLYEYKNSTHRTIVLLNAFNNDVYFAIEQYDSNPLTGYKKIDALASDIAHTYNNEQIIFIGDGALIHKEVISTTLGDNALISLNAPHFCSLEYLSTLGLQQYKKGITNSHYLLPLYLKKHPVELL